MKNRPQKINDKVIKWTGIPFTGILVFHLSGFAPAAYGNNTGLTVNYLVFIVISFALWNGSAYAHYLLRNHLYKIKKLYLRIPARYAVTTVVTWAISYVLLCCWNYFLQGNRFAYHDILNSQIIMVLISIQVSSIYEIVYLNKERESDLIKIERSEKLKAQAQLDALKSQIDPHFIFNSLNTLSYLISQNPEKAKLFNDTLAKVYRYILINKEKDLIQLKQEIEFASNYFYLLKIRYQTGLHMRIKMDDLSIENYSIPPLSLQALIENAIKHNHFSEKYMLNINITISGEEIKVENQRHHKNFDMQSSKIGLANLNERYSLIVNKGITVDQTNEYFSVLLPIVKANQS